MSELGAQYVDCELCGLPRTAEKPQCPFCGHPEAGFQIHGIPEDFGRRLVAEGRWEAAAALFEGEAAEGRQTSQTSLYLAWISFITNDLRAVETWSHESIRLDGRGFGPHLLLGLVFERAGRWEEAVAEYSLAQSKADSEPRRELLQGRLDHCKMQIPEW